MSWMSNKIGKNDIKYTPVNKEKYMGKTRFAVCRSSWELVLCRYLDSNPSVLQWKSEPFGIPYFDPTQRDKKNHLKKRMYYPDFIAKIKNNNKLQIWLIEVKPYKETMPPKTTAKKKKKTLLREARTWEINQAKWKAAINYCNRKGWKFKILTEKQIMV